MRIVIAMAIALMAASHSLPAGADERSETADKVYEYVMERMKFYASINQTKAMVICIDWDAPTASGINVYNAFSYRTGEGSDIPIFTSKLAQSAKYECKKWVKSEKIDCTCKMLDSNGKNVLKVPPRN